MKSLTIAAIAVSSTLLFSACTGKTAEQNTTSDMNTETNVQEESMAKDAMVGEEKTTGETEMMDGEAKMMSGYVEYSESVVADTIAAGKTPVLFFHATWCPSCKAADKDITTNTSEIPKNIVIIKTDYDTTGDLKKKYGVTTQHTFVQLDESMAAVTKWSGGSLKDVIENVK